MKAVILFHSIFDGMGLFDFLFDGKNKIVDFKNRGAVILDVRTQSEYDVGHIPGSTHIPLQEISSIISEIKKWGKPIITCCASGGRSATAEAILKSAGIEAINGGGWKNIYKRIESQL